MIFPPAVPPNSLRLKGGFGRGSRGELYVVTGNIGRVYRLGAAFEKSGSFESDVLDAGAFAYWGRIGYRGSGNIRVLTRSGNLNRPENNWSAWAPLQSDSGASAEHEYDYHASDGQWSSAAERDE